jgi:hypothetical protein
LEGTGWAHFNSFLEVVQIGHLLLGSALYVIEQTMTTLSVTRSIWIQLRNVTNGMLRG